MHQVIRDILIETSPDVEPRFWYMSFHDASAPEHEQFLGCCFVAAKTVTGMIKASEHLKCNPGGELSFRQLPPGVRLPARWLGRLLSKETLEAMDAEVAEDL